MPVLCVKYCRQSTGARRGITTRSNALLLLLRRLLHKLSLQQQQTASRRCLMYRDWSMSKATKRSASSNNGKSTIRHQAWKSSADQPSTTEPSNTLWPTNKQAKIARYIIFIDVIIIKLGFVTVWAELVAANSWNPVRCSTHTERVCWADRLSVGLSNGEGIKIQTLLLLWWQ